MKYTVIVDNIKVPVRHTDAEIIGEAKKRLKRAGISAASLTVHRKSIDARKRDNIFLVCSAAGTAELQDGAEKKYTSVGIRLSPIAESRIVYGSERLKAAPIIVGFGPAGMFCALELARHGYLPVVYERGGDVTERVAAVDRFMRGGAFSPESNIQFGAGGAGTFSDGKLTTRIGDPLCREVLERLCALGAPHEIMWQAKPHIGTDVLRGIIQNVDREISRLGGRIYYRHKVSCITDDAVTVAGESVRYGALVLAVGHSARDTYAELKKEGYVLTPKPFSVGVRIEHLREDIDEAMYGSAAGMLPSAEYAVSHRVGERGVYTFCMCPGGVVVPAASEDGGVVTNGMSYSARNGRNSNSAVAVSVLPEDYGSTVEGAVEFQRRLERDAFLLGGGDYAAPAETVGSFVGRRSNSVGRITPTYMDGKVKMCSLSALFPDMISDMLRCGIKKFGTLIKGFDCDDAMLTGVETRTSAPVRILRGEDRRIFERGSDIYPCGEGAGYAGGIMSAAVDGIKTARAIMARFAPPES